ncbi:malate synthase, partial [Helicosporidium sp. ATCC 50920]
MRGKSTFSSQAEDSAAHQADYDRILTRDALNFVADLARSFTPRVEALLQARRDRQERYDAGALPGFLPETASVRHSAWRVAPAPADIRDRRVEITGPTDRKMVINALNSGANVYMADFEDSNCPTWDNMVRGQANLMDAVRREISYEHPDTGRRYALGDSPAVLMVRPRGWHLWERHALVDGRFVPGALFDFGLFFFHNAEELVARGSGPYFYLPKMESYLEARLWNDVFVAAQQKLGVPRGTARATCLIETLPAVFQMDEILYELREHSAGLNCGRWDYVFSVIKTLRAHPTRIFPDRSSISMLMPFLRAYTLRVVDTCHRRGAFAMGGMSAAIPIKNDPAANARVEERIAGDKLREVADGHDGTWVAHPGLIALARKVFDAHMPDRPNNIPPPAQEEEWGG